MSKQNYNLREKQRKSIFQCYSLEQQDLNDEDESDKGWNRRRLRTTSRTTRHKDFDYQKRQQQQQSDIFNSQDIVDKLPQNEAELNALMSQVKTKLKTYKQQFQKQQAELKTKKSYVNEDSIPICADITTYNFDQLIKKQLQFTQSYFDVIMMDPPWKLSTSQPSRGVAIQYDSLSDQWIEKIPVHKLQKNGVLIVWAINAKYAFTIKLMNQWGYKLVDSITWVKKTVNGKIAKGHGYYLQHAKQTCLIGIRGDTSKLRKGVARDVIFSDRRGQSQKPSEIYDYIEQLVPNGYYLEVFGRRNNLRQKWVTVGNEI